MVDRQHGESGAQLPRHLAKQRGREVCHAHNTEQSLCGWIDRRTGRRQDTTGTFEVEVKKKRRVAPPPK